MGGHGWLILAFVALPLTGFSVWVLGQILKARHEETENILSRGLLAEAEIISCDTDVRGTTIHFRFVASGWDNPITVSKRVAGRRKYSTGEKIEIRYLPRHPHMSVILPRDC